MAKHANQAALTAAILNNTISLINKGEDITTVRALISAQFNLKSRSVDRHIARAQKAIFEIASENAETARKTWRARIEQQYRDTYQINDIDKRLRRQEAIAALGIKLSGADQAPPRSVNVFNFYPGQTGAAIHTEYTVDTDDSPVIEAVSVPVEGEGSPEGSPADERPVWAMP
jgi:hypothetical protein